MRPVGEVGEAIKLEAVLDVDARLTEARIGLELLQTIGKLIAVLAISSDLEI